MQTRIEDIRYQDHKAAKFYRNLWRQSGLDPSNTSAFVWLMSQSNFVHRWLRLLLRPQHGLYFRFKFLTVYHSLSGLDRLKRTVRGNRNKLIGHLAAELLGTVAAARLKKTDSALRNAMAHYQLRNTPDHSFSPEDPIRDVVRALSPCPFEELDALLDGQLDAMSNAFRSIVSPGFFARRFEG